MTSAQHPASVTARAFLGFALYLLLVPAILFVTAGTLDWWLGWAYVALTLTFTLGSRLAMARKHPDLVAERAGFRDAEGVEPWDRVLVPLIAIYGPLATLLIAALEVRFEWRPEVPLWLSVAAFVLLLAGLLFATWAVLENRFFSAVVRIQHDRGHTVCSTGPYRYVRHPGYAGGLLTILATPLALGSVWALAPTALTIALTVLRTALEDSTLMQKLSGYEDYAARARFRLVPGLW